MKGEYFFLGVCLVLFFVCSLTPAVAVKILEIDHGTKYYNISHPNDVKITWKTYQYQRHGKINNNFVKRIMTVYFKENGIYVKNYDFITTITKTDKNTVKLVETVPGDDWGINYSYVKTPLSAAQYYWKVYRPRIQPL